MAEGLSEDTANSILAAQFQGTSYVETAVWVQLYLAAPGPVGLDNPCVDTSRADASASFGTPPSGGSITSDAATGGPWDSATAAENPTHFGLWSLASGGTFIGSGTISGLDASYQIPAGAFTFTFPVAA